MSMTQEEAIKWLEETIQDTDTYWTSRVDTLQKELDEQKEVFLLAISALRSVSREQVERMRGMWIENQHAMLDSTTCSNCKTAFQKYYENYPFCPRCGAPMKDEAVDIIIQRLESLNDGDGE